MISVLLTGSMSVRDNCWTMSVICFTGSVTDRKPVKFFIIQSAIVVIYENQALVSEH